MLFLLFQVGQDRFALEASHVVEVVPLLNLKKIHQAPRGVAGLFNYRGQPVPAVDLCDLTLNKPADEYLSTRIIIVQYPDAGGNRRLLGLIAEQATDLMRKNDADFTDPNVRINAAPYLGPVIMDAQGSIQWIHEQRLLSDSVRDMLFSEVEVHTGSSEPGAPQTP
jgi:chemotaxis-related protein WspB